MPPSVSYLSPASPVRAGPSRWRIGVAALLFLTLGATRGAAACPPEDFPQDRLQTLKASGFKLEPVDARVRLAQALLQCLRAPDPFLRDAIAFEALSAWMRGGQLPAVALKAMSARLLADLALPDPAGFGPAFAALVLAELARVDRRSPLWSREERQQVLAAAVDYLSGLRDYRGFDEREGWRHGVAHAADLLMQLSLNPLLERADLDRILDGIASQVLAQGMHAYVHGESERLLRPVVFVARRGLHAEADWSAWLGKLALAAAPAPGAATDGAGLVRLHNARAFFYPLYVALAEGSDGEPRRRLLPGLLAAVRSLQP